MTPMGCVPARRGAGLYREGSVHPGHLPAQLPMGHVRRLDRVSRELLARAWATGGGPGDGPLTIDLDSTNCETFGLAKEGARRHNYAGRARLPPPCWPPLPAPATC